LMPAREPLSSYLGEAGSYLLRHCCRLRQGFAALGPKLLRVAALRLERRCILMQLWLGNYNGVIRGHSHCALH